MPSKLVKYKNLGKYTNLTIYDAQKQLQGYIDYLLPIEKLLFQEAEELFDKTCQVFDELYSLYEDIDSLNSNCKNDECKKKIDELIQEQNKLKETHDKLSDEWEKKIELLKVFYRTKPYIRYKELLDNMVKDGFAIVHKTVQILP